VERFEEIATVEELGTILTMEPPLLYRFAFKSTAAPNLPGSRGVYERRLTRTATGTQLKTTRHLDLSSWRGALFEWVDDGYARLDTQTVRSFEAKEEMWAKSGRWPLLS
jgi:hypothetical protein